MKKIYVCYKDFDIGQQLGYAGDRFKQVKVPKGSRHFGVTCLQSLTNKECRVCVDNEYLQKHFKKVGD